MRSTLLALVALTAACGADGSGRGGSVARDSAGITIVENDHTRPAWESGSAWRLSAEPAVQIGTVDGDLPSQLFRVTDAKRLRDGTIAVVNSGTADVRVYDRRGLHVVTFGRRGQGPGEFGAPWVVYELSNDSLLVIDLNRTHSVFDRDRTFVRRFTLQSSDSTIISEIEPAGRFADGSLLVRGHGRSESAPSSGLRRGSTKMMRFDGEGRLLGAIGEFDGQGMRYGPQGALYVFGPWPREAAAEESMWYGRSDRFELREVGFDGRTRRLVRLDRPNRSVTQADRDAFVEASTERVRGTDREQILRIQLAEAMYAPEFPAHFDLLQDDAGNLWVQDYQPFNARVERVWSVFDPDGRFLGDVDVPAGVTVTHIGDDFLLGIWRDEFDVEYVRLYDLEKS
jgi:hypothetical protein